MPETTTLERRLAEAVARRDAALMPGAATNAELRAAKREVIDAREAVNAAKGATR